MTLDTEIQPKPAKKTLPKRQSFLKKIDVEAAKQLSQLKDKVNKKPFGRKVRDAELIALGLTLIEQRHLAELQEETYSEKDRLAMAHEEYQRANGKLSLDQFIGRLLKGEIEIQRKN
jgi:hypothetical protein